MKTVQKVLVAVAALGLLAAAGCKQPLDLSMQRNRIFLLGRLLVGQTCDVRVIWRKAPNDIGPVKVTADLSEIGGDSEQELTAGDNGTWRWTGQLSPDTSGERLITITAVDAQEQKKEVSKRFRVYNTDKAIAIAAGAAHSLALKADGTVTGWLVPLLANGSLQCYRVYGPPFVPENLSEIVAIAAGDSYNLALKADGTVTAWGLCDAGQCDIPPSVSLGDVVAISAGSYHSLALKADGTVKAWGVGGAISPPPDLNDVISVSASGDNSIALKADGTVVAWGKAVPSQLNDVVAVAAGRYGNLALKADGTVIEWDDYYKRYINLPYRVGNLKATAIASGILHWMALKDDGSVMIWWQQVNFDTYYVSDERLQDIIAIAEGTCNMGTTNSMALTKDGRVLAWEELWNGQVALPVPEELQ